MRLGSHRTMVHKMKVRENGLGDSVSFLKTGLASHGGLHESDSKSLAFRILV